MWYNLEPGKKYIIRDKHATFVGFVWNKEYKQWFLQFHKNEMFTISPLLQYTFKEYNETDIYYEYE